MHTLFMHKLALLQNAPCTFTSASAPAKASHPPKASAPKSNNSFAVVIIDMQNDPNDSFLSYRHGTLGTGIRRVCDLLAFARENGISIILVELSSLKKDNKVLPTVPDIVQAAGLDYHLVTKRVNNAFYSDVFPALLESLGSRKLIIGGFNRCACVKHTTLDAWKRGFDVLTSGQIQFGGRYADRLAEVSEAASSYLFYRFNSRYFSKLDSLFAAVRDELAFEAH